MSTATFSLINKKKVSSFGVDFSYDFQGVFWESSNHWLENSIICTAGVGQNLTFICRFWLNFGWIHKRCKCYSQTQQQRVSDLLLQIWSSDWLPLQQRQRLMGLVVVRAIRHAVMMDQMWFFQTEVDITRSEYHKPTGLLLQCFNHQ